MYGYASPEELLKEMTDIRSQLYVRPERRAGLRELLEKQGEVHEFESQAYRKDGTVIWISENVPGVRDEAGKIVRYEGMVEGITERKRAEEALRATAER
jgi:PAS domain S-box-containing protein